MQGFKNDINSCLNEYSVYYWALAHPIFKITFQSGCLRDFRVTVGVLSYGLLCVFFYSVFSGLVIIIDV